MTEPAPRAGGMRDVAKAVLFGLIGVRRRADHEGVHITPLQYIVAGVALAVVFVFALIMIVRTVAG